MRFAALKRIPILRLSVFSVYSVVQSRRGSLAQPRNTRMSRKEASEVRFVFAAKVAKDSKTPESDEPVVGSEFVSTNH